jgi:methionyl aminopeptidase
MPWDPAGRLVAGVVSPERPVPRDIPRPEYVGKAGPTLTRKGDVYSFEEVGRIREAGRIAARAVDAAGAAVRPGVTTEQLDEIVHDFLVAHRAYPSTLGYRGYPKSSCTSVNEVICHGIPDDTVLRDGDIVNIDVTAYHDGMHGDLNRTFLVGDVAPGVRELVERTEAAMLRGVKTVAPGRQVNVIGRAIESYAARFGYGVVRDYTGHGVGTHFHSGLVIPHWDDPRGTTVMEPGMVFTIEPMLTLSGEERWDLWPDDWTVVTRDRSWTAQFEHTLVVTETGAELLTLP